MIAFCGYSDDVVLCGTCAKDVDEKYDRYYLLSNGSTVKAKYGNDGWEFSSTHPNTVVIPIPENRGEHTDTRIPSWLEPSEYTPVLIIDDAVSIIASQRYEFPDNVAECLPAFTFLNLLRRRRSFSNQ